MPDSTGVVQEAGVPLRPSISTRHSRQEPNASSMSVAQSFGILLPSVAAAAITDVPAGTLTSCPSIVSVTLAGPTRIGVPASNSWIRAILASSFRRNLVAAGGKIFREMIERAQHRQRRQAAQSAERAIGHHRAQIAHQRDIGFGVHAGDDLIDRLEAARRADPAGRAF